MKSFSLSTKIALAASLALGLLGVAIFGILYKAQTAQAFQEMDALLQNETLAFSTLVSGRPQGAFDFEMTPQFFSQYTKLRPGEFFRFVDTQTDKTLRESAAAPDLACKNLPSGISSLSSKKDSHLRVMSSVFRPERDPDLVGVPPFEPALVCLVVGLDEAPYRELAMKNVASTVPVLVFLFGGLIAILWFLVRRLTQDLSALAVALGTADFRATHEFPPLPEAHTKEVKAVNEKLLYLHEQASHVYEEMWLFLGRAAHQLKTPVAAMQATLQVLARKPRSQEELMAGLSDVALAAQHLANLTKKLISSSRLAYQENFETKSISLREYFAEQAQIFGPLAEQKGVTLDLSAENDLQISANPVLLNEIFSNLIENAILYSPRDRRSHLKIQWSTEGAHALIKVQDQGLGIPEAIKESLFQPFVRGDERLASGSGLGLSVAKKASQLLNGQLDLHSTNANGTEMHVLLPLG